MPAREGVAGRRGDRAFNGCKRRVDDPRTRDHKGRLQRLLQKASDHEDCEKPVSEPLVCAPGKDHRNHQKGHLMTEIRHSGHDRRQNRCAQFCERAQLIHQPYKERRTADCFKRFQQNHSSSSYLPSRARIALHSATVLYATCSAPERLVCLITTVSVPFV